MSDDDGAAGGHADTDIVRALQREQQAHFAKVAGFFDKIASRLEALEARGAPPDDDSPVFCPAPPEVAPADAVATDDVLSQTSTALGVDELSQLAASIGLRDPANHFNPDASYLSETWLRLISASAKSKSSMADINAITASVRALLVVDTAFDHITSDLPAVHQSAVLEARTWIAAALSECAQQLSLHQVRASGTYTDEFVQKLRDASRAKSAALAHNHVSVGGLPLACAVTSDILGTALQRKLDVSMRELAGAASGSKLRSDSEGLDAERKLKDLQDKYKKLDADHSSCKSYLGRAQGLLDKQGVAFDSTKFLSKRSAKPNDAKKTKPAKTQSASAAPAAPAAGAGP